MNGGWLQHVGIFAATAVLSLLLTPLAIRLAFRRGVMDKPGGHKSHTSPVPYLGGLAIVTAFASAVLVASWVDSSTSGTDELLKVLATNRRWWQQISESDLRVSTTVPLDLEQISL